jgi:hypothetical protein
MGKRSNKSKTDYSDKMVDLLDEDRPIAGQKYCCVSFVSPEKIIKQRNMFLFEKFLSHFDFSKSMKKFEQFIAFQAYKYDLDLDSMMKDYQEFIESEKSKLVETTIEDDYKTFLDQNEENLNDIFKKEYTFQTSVRGVKFRGSFPSLEEAEMRARLLRENDPNHDIYVGQVGMWMPWEPEAYKTGRVEYLEKELNQLMKEKKANEDKARQHFDQRVKDTKRNAIENNIKVAKEKGIKLTQNIDENDELVGETGASTLETQLENENEQVTVADVRRELFESDDVRTKETDKQYEEMMKEKFKKNELENVEENENESDDSA